MQSRSETIKDRNGVDTRVGDLIFFLRGSVAGDNYYETCDEVVEVHPRKRMVKVEDGTHLFWHEFWKEE